MKQLQHFLILGFLWLLAPNTAFSQNADTTKANGIIQTIKFIIQFRGFDYAAQQIDTAYAIYKGAFGPNSLQASTALHFRGLNYYFVGKQEEATIWYDSSLHIRERLNPKPYLEIAKSHNNIGLALAELGKYREALAHHEMALELRLKYAPMAVEVAHSWANIGQNQGIFGEYYLAESYSRLALQRLLSTKPPLDLASIASVQNNLAGAFLGAEQLDSAIVWSDKARKTWEKINPDSQRRAQILTAIGQNKASAYMKKGQHAEALKSLDMVIPSLRKTDPLLINLYSNRAGIWIDSKKPDSSLVWSAMSIALSQQIFGKGHWTSARGYINLASAYSSRLKPSPDSAAMLIDSAFLVLNGDKLRPSRIHVLLRDYFKQSGRDIESETDFEEALLKLGIQKEFEQIAQRAVLLDAAKVYNEYCMTAYESSHDIDYLRQSIMMSRVMDKYFDYCRANFSDAEARQLIQSFAFILYERGVYALNELRLATGEQNKTIRRAFYFSEKSKALSLFESVRAARALNINGIDSTLLKKEEDFRAEIALAERNYFTAQDAQKAERDPAKAAELEKTVQEALIKLSGKRILLDNVLKKLNKSEKFQQARQEKRPISLDEATKMFCNDSTSLLSYLIGDTSVFIFVLNQHSAEFREIRKDFPIRKLVETFRHNIDSSMGDNDSQKRRLPLLTASGYQLYTHLVAPVAASLKPNIVLIPDGDLCAVPFEALLCTPTEAETPPSSWDFLVRHHSFLYGFSTTLLREMASQSANNGAQKFLGFAPWYFGAQSDLSKDCLLFIDTCNNRHGNLTQLPCSGSEINCIAAAFAPNNAKVLFGNNATLKKFMELAPSYGIIHLSLHAEADERVGNKACIVFDGTSRLYIRELYNMKLKADMVVLSACKTGLGKYRRGEGIISLARGFALAGAKSVLHAMWETEDGASRTEMLLFYNYALSGQYKTKSAALTAAKREMLTKNDSAHPFRWAAFLLTGDDSPL